MQSRVVEIDDLGPVRRRANNGEEEEQKGPREYPERDPLDLIEEDKRPFARRKLLATCCGGCRTVYDEVTAQAIHPGLIVMQILIYLFFPVMIIVFGLVAMSDKDMRMEACAAVGGIAFLVCGALHIASWNAKRGQMMRQAAQTSQNPNPSSNNRPRLAQGTDLRPRQAQQSSMQEDDEEEGFCSKKSLFFLVPPRITLPELITVLVLAPLYGFFATYLCHPATAEEMYPDDDGQRDLCVALSLVVVFFSSYSLIGEPIPEVTPYGTDDSFSLFSHHYQRIYYQIVISIVLLIAEKGSDDGVVMYLFVPGIYWANFIVLLLQMVGWLSNPFVTGVYLMEQTEILLFGGTARASDVRILASFTVTSLFIIIFTHTDVASDANLTIVYALIAFILSKNYLHTFGLKKPFQIENEDMMQQRAHAQIVFANLATDPEAGEQKRKEQLICTTSTLIYNTVGFAVVLVAAIVFQVLFIEEDDPLQIVFDWTKDAGQDRRDFIVTFSYLGIGLSVVIFIIGSLSKRILCRVIPGVAVKLPTEVTRIATLLMQAFSVGCATVIVLNQTQAKWYEIAKLGDLSLLNVWDDLAIGIQVMFSLRAFKRALTAPLLFQLEIFVALIVMDMMKDDEDFWKFWVNRYNLLGMLAFAHFVIHRGRVLVNKITYIVVSIFTAFKNKKQRIRSQWVCFTLQLTFLLPYFLGVLLWTTMMDVALLPTFGFAFFTAGYLKPLRCWSVISPVQANQKESVSDGHLFQAMQGQLNEQIRQMVLKDPVNFEAGSFYLLKNEKMIILIQVLERADGFVVFTSKGSELQETTICHAEENEHINEVMKKVFEQKQVDPQILFSLSPIRQVEFALYSDLKYSLAGMITDAEFANMTKKYFMSILAYRLQKILEAGAPRFVRIMTQDLATEDCRRADQFINDAWLSHLDIKDTALTYQPIRQEQTRSRQDGRARDQPTGGLSFLEQINQDNQQQHPGMMSPSTFQGNNHSSINRDVEGTTVGFLVDPASRARGMPEDQMFDELEDMLGKGGGGINSQPKMQGKGIVRKNSQSRIVPMNDLEDLEDMYQFDQRKNSNQPTAQRKQGLPPRAAGPTRDIMKQGMRDDLDEELEDFNPSNAALPQNRDMTTNASPSRDVSNASNPRKSSAETREPGNLAANNTTTSAPLINPVAQVQRQAVNDLDLPDLTTPPVGGGGKKPPSQGLMDDLEDLNDLMEGGESEQSGSVKQFLQEAFCMVFKDDFTQFSSAMNNAFNNSVQSTIESRKFLQSNDERALFLKNEILYAARLGMHLSMDKFVMGDFDIEEGLDMKNAIELEYGKWFLGGEPFVWNSAIEKRMPQLERIITKKNQYFMHQLKYGQASDADSRFSVFEFRREVARAIWANLNSELIYYTNANDERFSIQAEKDILRNLLVHLAEIPLGYPVYASGAQTVYY